MYIFQLKFLLIVKNNNNNNNNCYYYLQTNKTSPFPMYLMRKMNKKE